MSTKSRVIKNTAFLYIRTIASLLLGIFTARFLLKGLGAEDFGIYNVVGGSISMLGFLSASLGSSTQRFISYAQGEGKQERIVKIFNNALLIHNVLAVMTVVILVIAGFFFFNGVLNIPDGKFADAMFVYGCLLVTTVFSITVAPYEAAINAHENMLFYSVVGVTDVVLKFGIALGILFCDGDKLVIYAVLMSAEALAMRFASQVYCRRKYEECRRANILRHYEKSVVKEMLSFTGWNLTNICTGMISLFGMNLVINHYFGVELNAAMGIATQLSGILMGMSENMIKAVTPVLVKSEGGHQRERMLSVSLIGCKFSFLLFAFFGIPVMFYIAPVLDLWLTEIPDWTIPFCLIMIANALVNQMTVILYQSISAEGNVRNYNIARSVSNIMPLLISILMVSVYDFNPCWVLINWLVWKSVIGGLVNVYYSHKNLGLSYKSFLSEVMSPCLLTIAASSLIFLAARHTEALLSANPFAALILSSMLTMPVYFRLALTSQQRAEILLFLKSKLPICL